MLKDCDWSIDRDYKTGTNDEPMQFYLDGLSNSSEFHLLLGYFSSAAINLLSIGFATFISMGGKMRMVINHLLSEKDKQAIINAEEGNTKSKVFDINDVVSLGKVLDEYDTHFFECLSYLISKKRIEIKVIKPKNGKGIAHYKSGVFYDGEDSVAYKASSNFTLFGLSENLEELEAFLSWENGRSNKLIRKELRTIDNYFAENDENVDYVSSNEIEIAIRDKFGNKDINELIVQEEQLLKKKQSLVSNPKLKKTIINLYENIENVRQAPRFPYVESPREYQIEAYKKWKQNGFKGVFAMATGTGKTITALNCLLNEYNKTKVYRAIITVPTTALVEQWKKECAKFNFKNIITVSSNENWDNILSFFNTASLLIKTSYIVIVTYASLPKARFQSYFKQLPKDTVFIADETHNLGSQSLLKLLPKIHLEKRIGLSATPYRKFDEEGNIEIQKFFSDTPPYIVSYTMEQALKIGWLCQYTYYPHIVKLTDFEMEEYKNISRQLAQMGFYNNKTGEFKSSPIIEMKLLERKRIIHKAANKLDAFKEILKIEFEKRGNLKYSLIYVPEGMESKFDDFDFTFESEDEKSLIIEYTKAVSMTDDDIMVKQFTSKTSDRNEVLKNYEQGNIHVLTSMKCLDEGVDVPRSELAIFCASTGNPRQFIQRRGRVLRLHKDKTHATIHDLVVVPEIEDESTFEMEKNLIKKELERVVDFSKLSMNKSDTYETFKKIIEYYNLNLNDL